MKYAVEIGSDAMKYIKSEVVPVLNQLSICHKDILGSGGISPHILTYALDRGEWPALRPAGRVPCTY
jgi:hypothetical protein